jgi:putative transposase
MESGIFLGPADADDASGPPFKHPVARFGEDAPYSAWLGAFRQVRASPAQQSGVNRQSARAVGPARTRRLSRMQATLHAQVPGHPLHVIQRGYCRVAYFFCDRDRLAYLHWLGAYAEHFGCAVHAYVLMGNHVHLLVTPSHPEGASRLMQALSERYTRYIGEAHERSGPLMEERLKALTLRSRRHLLECMRYIESNPVRAGLAAAPGEYRWSSFRANAMGHDDALVTPHSCYYALGRSAASRRAAYRKLFENELSARAPRRVSARAGGRY